jgi:hypothetical protein
MGGRCERGWRVGSSLSSVHNKTSLLLRCDIKVRLAIFVLNLYSTPGP